MLKPFLFFYPIIFHVFSSASNSFFPFSFSSFSTSCTTPFDVFLTSFLSSPFPFLSLHFLMLSSTVSPSHSLSTLFVLLLSHFSFFSSLSSSRTSFTILFTFSYFLLLFSSTFLECLFCFFFLSNDYLSDFQISSRLISYFSFIFFSLFGYFNLG